MLVISVNHWQSKSFHRFSRSLRRRCGPSNALPHRAALACTHWQVGSEPSQQPRATAVHTSSLDRTVILKQRQTHRAANRPRGTDEGDFTITAINDAPPSRVNIAIDCNDHYWLCRSDSVRAIGSGLHGRDVARGLHGPTNPARTRRRGIRLEVWCQRNGRRGVGLGKAWIAIREAVFDIALGVAAATLRDG